MSLSSQEKRAHRINYLLRFYLQNKDESLLFTRTKEMGVDDSTAKEYCKMVLIQVKKMENSKP